jgi:hypothetical protein
MAKTIPVGFITGEEGEINGLEFMTSHGAIPAKKISPSNIQ